MLCLQVHFCSVESVDSTQSVFHLTFYSFHLWKFCCFLSIWIIFLTVLVFVHTFYHMSFLSLFYWFFYLELYFLLFCISSNIFFCISSFFVFCFFLVYVRHYEFYLFGCWIILNSFKYSWAFSRTQLNYLKTSLFLWRLTFKLC